MKTILLSTVAIAMLSTAVSAADLDVAPEPIMDNWAGWYAGLNIGYGFANDPDVNITGSDRFQENQMYGFIPYSLDPESSGVFGGGQVGYNWQGENFVYGLEGDFQFSDIDGRDAFEERREHSSPGTLPSVQEINGNGQGGLHRTSARQKLKWFSTVRGRFGLPLGETFLFYGTAGLAFGKVKNQANAGRVYRDELSPSHPASYSKTKVGWTAGFGSEMKITEAISFKVEYLYLDLGKKTLNGDRVCSELCEKTESTEYASYKFKNQFHTVKAGFNWGF